MNLINVFQLVIQQRYRKTKNILYFPRQDALKYIAGDLEKSIFKFGPKLWTFDPDVLYSNFATLPKICRIEISKVFSHSLSHME